MSTVSQLTVSNAVSVGSTDWVAVLDTFGPQLIPSPAPRGDCVIRATTLPSNAPAEWARIVWSGGEPIPGAPNQRLVRRGLPGTTAVEATLDGRTARIVVWVFWAEVEIRTSGPRPPRARKWSDGALFTGGDRCGAFTVPSPSMGENARGQVVAVATFQPRGVGRLLSALSASRPIQFRRQVTAHDFADGTRQTGPKSSGAWTADDSAAALTTLDPSPDDAVYDTDAPDLPLATTSAETYNNFRQWVEWGGVPCSNYGHWYFTARWRQSKVTHKDVGRGSITLPARPQNP